MSIIIVFLNKVKSKSKKKVLFKSLIIIQLFFLMLPQFWLGDPYFRDGKLSQKMARGRRYQVTAVVGYVCILGLCHMPMFLLIYLDQILIRFCIKHS